ncbi:glycosyltransferase family 4 protein [Aequorivita capsosiphonis]|uniref:glycosyltransferase family 4 protein n=1 Tax=Aequorivita capsosiphonis TaxID=487317 RepID=UPI0003FD2C3A|nr:glycosyltransferase family 4 protein [Aequorivita capsosiphonis]
MKVLFNTGHIYLHGGIEKSITERANYFVKQPGYEVFILTTEQQKKAPRYELDSNIKLLDLGINYNRKKSYLTFGNLKKAITHYRLQKKIFHKIKPDIILSPNFNFDHYWLPFIKNEATLIKERHNSIYKPHGLNKEKSFIKKTKQKFDAWIDKKYDHVVVLNQDEKDYTKGSNAVLIPNGVEKTSLTAPMENNTVIAAGRLAPVKRFEELIAIWKTIHKKFPDWELHIYGQDYLNTKKQLKAQIKSLGLQHTVFLKHSVNNLPEVMQEYSVLAMTSETECFPTVLLEALSVGLPIVSYDCPTGPRHIISDQKDGFLVEYNNREEFVIALSTMIQNKELRKKMGFAAKQNVERFQNEKVFDKWLDLFNQ